MKNKIKNLLLLLGVIIGCVSTTSVYAQGATLTMNKSGYFWTRTSPSESAHSWYTQDYSFHKGKIEYSSMDTCLSASEKISLKDTVDIINSWCMDVVDGQGTVLGEYLYINCSSGNCNKYKD